MKRIALLVLAIIGMNAFAVFSVSAGEPPPPPPPIIIR